MLNEDELHNAFSESFQLIDTLDYTASNVVILNIDSVEKFMMLAKSLEVSQVFFKYRYYFQDDFSLLTEGYEYYPDNVKNEVKKHNDIVESIDFSMPAQLELLILLSGTIMKVSIFDFWMDDLGILNKENKEAELEEQFLNEFKKIEEKEAIKKKDDKEELSEYILNDPYFSYKKNMHLRHDYLLDLFSKDEFKQYKYLFDRGKDRGISIPAKNFMDRLWQEYKERKNK